MIRRVNSQFLQLLLFFATLFIYFYNENSRFEFQYVYVLVFIFVISTFIFLFTKDDRNLKKIYYRPFLIFVFGYFILYFQRYIDLALGFVSCNDSVFLKTSLIVKSLSMSVVGYISLFLGYYSIVPSYANRQDLCKVKFDNIYLRRLFLFSIFLFLLFCAKGMISGNYSQEDLEKSAGGMTNYSSILLVVSYFSLLSTSLYNCIMLNNRSIKGLLSEFGNWNTFFLIVVTIFYLISGSRSHPFLFVCSFCFALLYLKQMFIPIWKIVLFLFVGSLFLTFIGATRNIDSNSMRDKMEALRIKSESEKTILPTTLELTGSLNTFLYSIDYVPSKHDFLLGSFHVRNLLSTIPFTSRITSQFLDPDKKYRSSDFFVTYIIQGEDYSFGNGTSINADLYLNYGFFGIIMGLFLLARLIRSIEWKTFVDSDPTIITLLFCAYLAGYALIYVRFSYLSPVNYLVFSLLLILYMKKFHSLVIKS